MGRLSDHLLAALMTVEASVSVVLMGRRRAAHRVLACSQQVPASPEEVLTSGVDLWRCCRAVSRAAIVLPWSVPCLPAAFALHRLLAWRGLRSRVELGATWIDGRFQAHAWVECGGVRLDPLAPEEAYAALTESRHEPRLDEGPTVDNPN